MMRAALASRCPRRTSRRTAPILLLGLAAGILAPETAARERLHRRFDHRNGLEVSHVTAIGQDGDGFLWLGVLGQLLRFDGSEFRRWNTDLLDFNHLHWHPGLGMLAKTSPDGGVWRVTGDGLEPLLGAEDPVLGPVWWLDVGPDGSLWLLEESGVLHRRTPEAVWSRHEPALFGGEEPRQVYGSRHGAAHVGTRQGLWRLEPHGSATRLLAEPGTKMVAEHPGGALYVTVRGRTQLREASRLLELHDGAVRTVHTFPSRPVDILVRGEDVWFTGSETFRYQPGGVVERLDPREDAGVPFPDLFVDREGSLWLGGYDGLVQFPEPDTFAFTAADGLPDIPAFGDFARTAEGIWVAFYDGLGWVRSGPDGGLRAETARRGLFAWDLCVDGAGRLWTFQAPSPGDGSGSGRAGVLERTEGGFRFHPVGEDPFAAGPCARSAAGTVWFLVGDQVYRTSPDGGAPAQAGPGPGAWETVFTEDGGRLWAGSRDRLCSIAVGASGIQGPWACEDVPQMGWTYDLHTMPSGAQWAATGRGLFRRVAGGDWEEIAGAPRQTYHEIIASPAGGFWITSAGPALRVAERPDQPEGLEVLERLTMWQGITSGRNRNLLEEPDGTLWITAPQGPIRVPPSARFAPQPVPAVALVEVLADGERLPVTGRIELPYARNRLELRFAALSYRDPGRVRYRVRSEPGDAWSETRTPGFRLTGLAPGRYQPEVIASLDGVHWSPVPARLSFRVRPPWYRTGWALALVSGAVALLLYAVYRARVAVLLRLERQRTRIAMDLHDEMGSGLGSIGILAALVSSQGLAPEKRDTIAGKIAATAEELGGKLRDILWSLRAPAADLQGLASHLAECGGRLFPGPDGRFHTAFPERWPPAPLTLAVRRNLQLIALEAMHNAARHAGASAVELGFDPSGRRWRMWIEDDGDGMPPARPEASAPERGIGLEAMRHRADQVGATIHWLPGRQGGTRVEVTFRPGAEDRRLRRRGR